MHFSGERFHNSNQLLKGPNSTENSNALPYIFSKESCGMDLRKFTLAHLRVNFHGKMVEMKTNKSNLLGQGRGKLQSAVYIISLVTCSGLERRNGDPSGNTSWKQGNSYQSFQIFKLKP